MPRRGRDLEKLVAMVERHLHGTEGYSVSSPHFLMDSDTDELREHDVVVVFKHDHHDLRVAIECRDRKAKVDSAAIGAFSEKCRATGVHSGVIVSSSGFTRPGLQKAARKNIRCLTLAQAEQFDWCLCPSIQFQQAEILDGMLECIASKPIECPYKVYRNDGTEFTGSDAGEIAKRELSKIIPLGARGGPYKQQITFGPQDGYVIGADGKRQNIASMNLWLVYEIREHPLPLMFHRYEDQQTGGEITSIATAKFEIGGGSAQITMIKTPNEGIQVSLTRDAA